jgi:hypothetical protein
VPKNILLYVVVGLAAVWYFFLRNKTSITGGANVSIATGNAATPYTGSAVGQVPPASAGTVAYGYPPTTQQPTAYGDTTGGILAGVGGLLGGLGTATGSVLSGLGSSGLLGGGGGSYGSGGSYDSGSSDSDSYSDF